MYSRTQSVIEEYCRAYRWRDSDGCLALCDDDVVAGWMDDRSAVPLAGLGIGRQRALRRFRRVNELFDLQDYQLVRLHPRHNGFRSRISFSSRHRETGEVIDGAVVIDWQLRGRRIIRAIHYHDRYRFEAFFRLFVAGSDKKKLM